MGGLWDSAKQIENMATQGEFYTNIKLSLLVGLIVLSGVLGCDSPPWASCIVGNATQSEMTVKFSTPYSMFSDASTYSPQDWSSGAQSCTPGK